MTFQVKLTILFLTLIIQVSAQRFIGIPDIHLRRELNKQGFTTNDSLDIEKTKGLLQLELNSKGIEKLAGLQYFEQVWRLELYNNKIKELDHLPPNLTDLNCANNKITTINNLPVTLKYLECSNNRISSIKILPPNLISFSFSNNSMKSIPQLPKTIQSINYFNNPISINKLPKTFRRSCDDPSQNCLPFELMNWRILGAAVKDTSLTITGMTIKLNSQYSWGFGSQMETINFCVKDAKLIADSIQVNRKYGIIEPNKKDSIYFDKMKCSVEVSKINQFLKDIYSNQMELQLQVGDSIKFVNLKNKKNGETCFTDCSDCTWYSLQYIIYSETDTITLNYNFNTGLSGGVTICSTNGPENIKAILDWLYIYKLTNWTFDKHELLTIFFNKNNLDRVIKWAM